MHEPITAQDVHQAERAVAMERGPNYKLVLDESLPPLHELIAEHTAMVQERHNQQREYESSFRMTMYQWGRRALVRSEGDL
jgi:hypothetical protein